MRYVILSVLSVAVSTGCVSYDPTLGETPFRCEASNDSCPKGYQCTEKEADFVCLRADLVTDDGDGEEPPDPVVTPPPFTCSDDSQLEPNDTLASPTELPVPSQTDLFSLEGLSICPVGDVDVFHFSADEPGKTITVTLKLRSDRGLLSLDVLDETGVSVRQGVPDNGDTEVLVAKIEDAEPGTYFAQVRAQSAETVNNYGIEISVLAPAP